MSYFVIEVNPVGPEADQMSLGMHTFPLAYIAHVLVSIYLSSDVLLIADVI